MKTSLTFITSLFLCLVQLAPAQSPAALPLIENIEIEFEGFKSVSDGYVMGYLQLREGLPYSSVLADQSIRSLYATNRFEFVEIKVEEAEEGAVRVILELVPKFTIGSITFDGSDRYSSDRLIEESEISIGIPLDEYSVAAAARKIQEYYVKKGFPESSVNYRMIKDSETGFANVIFDIVESRKLSIKSIDFEGVLTVLQPTQIIGPSSQLSIPY